MEKDIDNPQNLNTEENKIQELEDKIKDLEVRLEKETGDKSKLVEEIKDVRRLKQEAEAKAEELSKQLHPEDETDIKIKKALSEERDKQAKVNRDIAMRKFQEENKEFHPDNDTGGLKMSMLESQLREFDTSEFFTVDEFISVFKKAKKLIEPDREEDRTLTPPQDIVITPGSPKSAPKTQLTSKELQVIKELGWTEERFLKIKKSLPKYVESLLNR